MEYRRFPGAKKMKTLVVRSLSTSVLALLACFTVGAEDGGRILQLSDVFELEYASDPQISPDGEQVVYLRNSMDIMTDRRRAQLWIVNTDGTGHRPLTAGEADDSSPRWSPDGGRLVYVSTKDDSSQIHMRWMDTGQTAKLTQLVKSPTGLSWSPDGTRIAFSMLVLEPEKPFVDLPKPPEGATWAESPKVTRELYYRFDGRGYLEKGYTQIFVLPAEGGTPRQITSGPFHHGQRPLWTPTGTPSWTPDGNALVFSANRRDDWEYEPLDTEVHELSLADGSITALTDRRGPDGSPTVSPDGRRIAYLGFDDRYQFYQVTDLYVMNRDGGGPRCLTCGFDRDITAPTWSSDGKGLYFQYDDKGNTKIGFVKLAGERTTLAHNVGNSSIGRPYGAFGSQCFSTAEDGRFAFTSSSSLHPSDVVVADPGRSESRKLTELNQDLLGNMGLGEVEEFWYSSSFDDRKIQGWIVKPPGFEPTARYPLLLEIHGGPVANYGARFSVEMQLFAAAGYVVLYTNPRGSDSYGEEFGNLIHHNYPGQDYDDVMSGLDAVIARGYVDPERLFLTGGSAGGILSAWIVGMTDRFRAAAVVKPMVNFISAELTTDVAVYGPKYMYPGLVWENPEHYFKRSPLSLVGHVTTPTMLLTGEDDHRTPMAESEQFYAALKLREVDTALVRVPGASHHIAARPSHLIAKVAYILKWFEMHDETSVSLVHP